MCGFLQYMIVFSSLYKFCEQTMRCETRCLHFFAYTQKTLALCWGQRIFPVGMMGKALTHIMRIE